ncbi:MAG: beta-Ala-His dipeptidase [Clostridium sp.]|nr:beta-Ala-His dipeptidase [Clostridium sp.]
MRTLENLKPENVFYFFEEICKIPHGSGNTRQISNYLASFAKERGLEHYQDELGNVIIIKEASAGYEEHEPVMLQGHMDMVAVKRPENPADMRKDGLKLVVDGGRLFAEGTSLGGDDGIAVAYGLALLDGDYRHPRIELVVTVDEEVGMDGARALDVTPLKSKRLINLDSEEEGFFLAGCAGGARVNMTLSGGTIKKKGTLCELHVGGLKGGHSGGEIHKERGNAVCILGRALRRLNGEMGVFISSLEGGVADNAIPTDARAVLLLTEEKMAETICKELNKELKEELADKDEGVAIEITFMSGGEAEVMEETAGGKAIALLNALPHGVEAMSFAMPGLVETSLNPGLLSLEKTEGRAKVSLGISVRSSVDSAKGALIERLKSLAELSGAETEVTGDYPGWAYKKESPLRDKMEEVYEALYQKKPVVQAIHAGVECGLLAHKIPGLDCVSIGPDMKNIHTFEEELSISSTGRMWEYLLKLLETL